MKLPFQKLQNDNLTNSWSPGGGGNNILRVCVCAAHMGGFLGPTFSKQVYLFGHIFLKHGWVFQTLAKNCQKWVVLG